MPVRFRSSGGAAAIALLAAGFFGAAAAAPPAPAATVPLRIIAINDFHGYLQPPTGSSGRAIDDFGTIVDAGGAAYLATHLAQLRSQAADSVFVGTGDLIGTAPLLSTLFHHEPTIELFRRLGMKASAAGDHEFDAGYRELLRLQVGGCHPVDGCDFRSRYDGSGFPYLGANVVFRGTQIPALLPTWITYVQGIPVGYIGIAPKSTPTGVPPAGISALAFADEIAAANNYAALLDRAGVKAIVLMVHQGDSVTATNRPNECGIVPGGAGRIIAGGVSPKIDVVLAAHSHQAYNCVVNDPAGNPRPLIQGASFGRVLSAVDLQIDRKTRDVVRSKTVAVNRVVTRTVAPDPVVEAYVSEALALSAPVANRPVGTITGDITRSPAPTGETALGDLIADAMLAQTQAAGAQIALMNPGGIRADLRYLPSGSEGDGVVTYAEAFSVLPFGEVLTTLTLTGAQLDAVLEQQWQTNVARILQPSGLTYTQDVFTAVGSRVSNILVGGVPVLPTEKYRVTVPRFLATGGDGFSIFAQGTAETLGPLDLDAFTAYLLGQGIVAPPPTNRIKP